MAVPKWVKVALPAAAMGLGWGIRGVFGHQRGAMAPGALLGLALGVVSDNPEVRKAALRLGAIGSSAMAFGGKMTYGQTIGLTLEEEYKDQRVLGYTGLAIKGAVWIGLAGAFLGMGVSKKRYSALEVGALLLAMFGAYQVGVKQLNRPHQPPDKLPAIYFSKRTDPVPRPESWGGFWAALLLLEAYLLARGDRDAAKLGAWGMLAGGLGFPAGQAVQAWGRLSKPFGPAGEDWVDWWKAMEVTFGTVAGGVMGYGFSKLEHRFEPEFSQNLPLFAELATRGLWMLCYEGAMQDKPTLAQGVDTPLLGMWLPMTGVFGGKLWPWTMVWTCPTFFNADKLVRWQMRPEHAAWPVRELVRFGVIADGAGLGWLSRKSPAQAKVALVFQAWEQTAITLIGELKQNPETGALSIPSKPGQLNQALFASLALAVTFMTLLASPGDVG